MIRPREAADQAAAREFLARHSHLRVARLGELVRPLDHPALVAVDAGGQLLVLLTYVPGQDRRQWEILTLHAGEQWHGAGTALVEAVGQLARRQGCTRLWVITTNDNVDALRFYQRRGFCLVMVHRGAVDRSRAALKPEIPATGAYGIPLRDEIELEKQPLALMPGAHWAQCPDQLDTLVSPWNALMPLLAATGSGPSSRPGTTQVVTRRCR